MHVDIAIVGGGPAGLCLARALAPTGCRVAVIEQQSRDALREPPFDGREIALTQGSARILRELGIWQRFGPSDISPLRHAHVLNGADRRGLLVTPASSTDDALGFLVPNDRIRRAAFASVEHEARVALSCGVSVEGVEFGADASTLRLSDGAHLSASLVVAADSRFSSLRRNAGIGARMHDFGKTMLVCRMTLERAHDGEALEWFGHGQTLALLPLRGAEASVVLTLPPVEMRRVMAMDGPAFEADMRRRFDGRFGAMRLTSSRHTYPLVGVYAHRFAAHRFALAGDAAVGMHPVTAHGFNLGLRGVATLASLIASARAGGGDIASPTLLARYQRMHRRATAPLYAATLAVVSMYTDDRPPARLLRRALLGASRALPPVRQMMARALADHGPRVFAAP